MALFRLRFDLLCPFSDFDSDAFETWLEDLLVELKNRYGDKVVIVLDNAPYHGRQVSSSY